MKIDFNQPLRTIFGRPIKQTAAEDSPDFTLRDLALEVLLGATPQGAPPPLAKGAAFALAHRIVPGGEVELSAEEIAALKQRVDQSMDQPLIVGQAERMLEGQPSGLEPAAETAAP